MHPFVIFYSKIKNRFFTPQSKPMTQATMGGLGLLTFYQYLIHVVVHETAILNMLGMFMFVVATITWATPAIEIVRTLFSFRYRY